MANKLIQKVCRNVLKSHGNTGPFLNFVRAINAHGNQTTVDSDEVFKFSQLCQEFWDINGPFQALHTMNRLRVPLIKSSLLNGSDKERKYNSKPLKDKQILDVGCGGGILCEPLARLGANVTGIDASDDAIMVARHHSQHDPEVVDRVDYKCMAAEELLDEPERFDAVVASEVIEHVNDQDLFVNTCSRLIKPGGSLVFTTISKTWLSYLFAIGVAEYVLGVVEKGTHDWEKFITPDDLASFVISNGLTVNKVQGVCYNPFTRVWSNINDDSINYALVARKDMTEHAEDDNI